jgi:hypothetical protein
VRDFLLRLVESARGSPLGPRAETPAAVLDAPLEIDQETEAPPPAPSPTIPAGELAPIETPERPRASRGDPPTVLPPTPRVASDAAASKRPAASEHRANPVAPALAARQVPAVVSARRTPAGTALPVTTSPHTPAPDDAATAWPLLVDAVAHRPQAPLSTRRSPIRDASRPTSRPTADRVVRMHVAVSEPPPQVSTPVPAAPVDQVVRISIGRIEVRVAAPLATLPAARATLARPRQSLDDHLAERDRRRR